METNPKWDVSARDLSSLLLIAWAERSATVKVIRENSNEIVYEVVIKK